MKTLSLIGKIAQWLAVASILISTIGTLIAYKVRQDRLEQCILGYDFLKETLGIQFVDVQFIGSKAYCVTVYQGQSEVAPISKLEEYKEKWELNNPEPKP